MIGWSLLAWVLALGLVVLVARGFAPAVVRLTGLARHEDSPWEGLAILAAWAAARDRPTASAAVLVTVERCLAARVFSIDVRAFHCRTLSLLTFWARRE